MMENRNVYKFKADVIALAKSCTTVKPATAAIKAKALLDKYDDIFYNSTDQKKRMENQATANGIIKAGYFRFKDGSNHCILYLSNVGKVSHNGTTITVKTLSGEVLNFERPTFEHLLNVFGWDNY